MEFLNLEVLGTIFGGLITFVGLLWRYFFSPIKKIIICINEIKTDIAAMKPTIESINKQFAKNAGKTIADAIARLERDNTILEYRYRTVLSNTGFGVYECDATGKCTFANKALCDIFGVSLQEMLGNGWMVCVHHEDRERVDTDWKYALTSGIPYECHYRVVNARSKAVLFVVTKAIQVKDVFGNVIGWHGTLQLKTNENDVVD